MGFTLLPLGAFSGHPVCIVGVAVGIAISRDIRAPLAADCGAVRVPVIAVPVRAIRVVPGDLSTPRVPVPRRSGGPNVLESFCCTQLHAVHNRRRVFVRFPTIYVIAPRLRRPKPPRPKYLWATCPFFGAHVDTARSDGQDRHPALASFGAPGPHVQSLVAWSSAVRIDRR